jgi:hypothetical protein
VGSFRRRMVERVVAAKTPEHAVIVHYSLTGTDHGTEAERERVFALEDELIAAIEAHGVGEFDGNEFGGGEAVLYAYGPNAERLFAAMESILRSLDARPAFAILRFGPATDADADERRVEL